MVSEENIKRIKQQIGWNAKLENTTIFDLSAWSIRGFVFLQVEKLHTMVSTAASVTIFLKPSKSLNSALKVDSRSLASTMSTLRTLCKKQGKCNYILSWYRFERMLEQWALVEWVGEGTHSVVQEKTLVPPNAVVGSMCDVLVGTKKYAANILAIGMLTHSITFWPSHSICTGFKAQSYTLKRRRRSWSPLLSSQRYQRKER